MRHFNQVRVRACTSVSEQGRIKTTMIEMSTLINVRYVTSLTYSSRALVWKGRGSNGSRTHVAVWYKGGQRPEYVLSEFNKQTGGCTINSKDGLAFQSTTLFSQNISQIDGSWHPIVTSLVLSQYHKDRRTRKRTCCILSELLVSRWPLSMINVNHWVSLRAHIYSLLTASVIIVDHCRKTS